MKTKRRKKKDGISGIKVSCTRAGFTPRHQRNCMRGNKQNYKARSPVRITFPQLLSLSLSPCPFFSLPPLSRPPFPFSLLRKLLAFLRSLTSEAFEIEKCACAPNSHVYPVYRVSWNNILKRRNSSFYFSRV